ncbi:toll/interleukin-1 receptor domain-containing protein [Myroides odoratimimus]|uniref:toll/interleukin-1 receptor domain-containing protein n=1 Tax=Myroides odoratimimus TaxID=76832 RepID=UPI00257853BE|nr:toll/interleukin-1 receptor domain-containing protein [Myroides odoratimimus]MDM1521567.1 toll/interleukin-1 receptor domain-containing protein [Myroides odoratimimus]
MPFYTTTALKNISEDRFYSETQRIINESKEYTTFDIFLSHCFLDKEVVKGLFLDLTSQGYKVYVDWIIDPHLDRSNVTKESAEHIRNRMKSSKSLLLAISVNTTTSKWIPWELGFVDGYTNKCAVIPVYENHYNMPESYSGFEYLKLYPYIKKANNQLNTPKIWVIENPNKYVVFDDFLNNVKPYKRDIRI